MNIIVKSRQEIESLIFESPYIVVSISDPYSARPVIRANSNLLKTLYLQFHDIDNYIPNDKNEIDKKPITYFAQSQARNIIDFVKEFIGKDVTLIVHCEAGICRSAGVAASLSKCILGHDSRYFKQYIPNMLVYQTIINEWNKNGVQ